MVLAGVSLVEVAVASLVARGSVAGANRWELGAKE